MDSQFQHHIFKIGSVLGLLPVIWASEQADPTAHQHEVKSPGSTSNASFLLTSLGASFSIKSL